MSALPLVSPGTRLGANDVKSTDRPSAAIVASWPPRLTSLPAFETLARTVAPVVRSRTNTSVRPFVSPGTRSVAFELNATWRPSAESEGPQLPPSAGPPPGPG